MMDRFTDHQISFQNAFYVWVKIGLLSFGGPAGQIAVMHRILVEEKKWVSENRFLHALNYCMLLPGPEAQQLATYIGWLLHGWRGGIVSGILFVIPGFLSILFLSILYVVYQQTGFVVALFFGLKAATLAVVAEAVIRIGRRALRNRVMIAISILAFVSIFVFEVSFPLIVLLAGLTGLVGGRLAPEIFSLSGGHNAKQVESQFVINDFHASRVKPSWNRAIQVCSLWLLLWFGPIILLYVLFGPENIFVIQSIFFSKTAVVTFGGAYSVLAYIAQQAVEVYGWLKPGEMLDGLGMAETTPGPLIQVLQFVGFLGGYRNPHPFEPLTAALISSFITTWVTFTPCFLWIFLGAPHIEHMRGNRILSAGLSAITAAVVGVVLNLAVWFAIHVSFLHVEEWRSFGMRVFIPELTSINTASIIIASLSFIAILKFKWNMILTLGIAAIVGIVYKYIQMF